MRIGIAFHGSALVLRRAPLQELIRFFLICSAHGKNRQVDFLHKILCRYHLKNRPISVDKMTEMMISYLRKNRKYFERVTGEPMEFNFDKDIGVEKLLRSEYIRKK
jgi:hypothetical protein